MIEGRVNLTHLVAKLSQAQAHDLSVTVTLTTGHTVTGMIERIVIDKQRKIDVSRRDRSNLVATIGDQVVLVEDMREVTLGS